ncbi:MAG: 50S ribosomal protein L25 [Verrucomicrobia bacterium]|nr:50S ribosomal protein L25 [Verrucomicrobiota bacterium]
MKSVSLTAFPRIATKGSAVKKLRAQGRVPAVIYGRNKPQSLEINTKEIETIVHHSASENLLLDLAVDGANRLALVKEIQHHPLSRKILHIDLHEVAEGDKVTVTIPVEAIGEAVGVKAGGVLEHVLFKIKVRGTPKDLPEIINVDVSALEVGKTIHLGEIPLPPGVETLGKKEISVFSVAAPKTEAAEVATEGAPAGAVEMTKEKKEDAGAKKK